MKPFTLTFVDEVPEGQGGNMHTHDRQQFVEMLKTRPGHWAQYKPGKKHSVSGASVMRKDYPGVQASYRKRPDGGYDIYARWMGQ